MAELRLGGKLQYSVFSFVFQREMEKRQVLYYVSRVLSRNVKVKIYKTIILSFVLYGCETWSLTLREEHRLRVFENWVLRRIFGLKMGEVTGEWRKLHNEELHI
jgi:hypothetical protein